MSGLAEKGSSSVCNNAGVIHKDNGADGMLSPALTLTHRGSGSPATVTKS